MKKIKVLLSLVFATVLQTQALGAAVQSAVTVGEHNLNDDEWLGLTFQAHQYGTPLAEMARLWNTPFLSSAGRNQFNHQRDFIPAGTDTCCPNQDTLYSLVWLDLSQGPMVFSLPNLQGRYFVIHTTDLFGRNQKTFGPNNLSTSQNKILISGLGWQGEVPGAMQHLAIKANDALILLRIAPRDPSDIPMVRQLQDKLRLETLSGRPYRERALPRFDQDDPFNTLRILDEIARRNPLPGRDAGIMKTLKPLGIGQGEAFAPERLPEATQAIMKQAIAGSEALLLNHIPNVGDRTGQWLYLAGGDTFYNDTLSRATVAVSYILPNDEAVALYLIANTDIYGDQLMGSKHYTLTFKEPPPAREFWSLIAYSWPDVRLQTNAMGKYSVGDRSTGLKYEDNGNLVLHVSPTLPEGVNSANWLPLPDGEVSFVLRLYSPFASVVDRTWLAPDFVPVP
jgi:hypothetical protein